MFGYVRADTMELKVKEYELYRATYCGICRSMKRCCSCTSCLALSYDSVFLALLRLALSQEAASVKKRRCIVHPIKKRFMMEKCESLDYTARVAGTLAHGKVMDNIADSRGFRKFAAKMVRPFSAHWAKKANLDAELRDLIDTSLADQARLEKGKCDSADDAGVPFGNLMAGVCSYGVADAEKRRVAEQIGFHLGKTIYFMDACDDYEKDQAKNNYNPFVLAGENPHKNELIRTSIRMECRDAYHALQLLTPTDDGIYAILENLLVLGIPKEAERVLGFLPQPNDKTGHDTNAEERQNGK